jgi:hypothetical protein
MQQPNHQKRERWSRSPLRASNPARQWWPKSRARRSSNALRSKPRRRLPARQPMNALRSWKKSKSEARQDGGHPRDAVLTCGQGLSPKWQRISSKAARQSVRSNLIPVGCLSAQILVITIIAPTPFGGDRRHGSPERSAPKSIF